MRTERPAALGAFQAVSGRAVVADFDDGAVTSDGGALPLGQADAAVGLVDRVAACFEDHRDARFMEHSVWTFVGRRVFGIALGYEGSIDRDVVRGDPVMAVLAGKLRAKRRNCAPVAGKSTLNRLELGGLSPSRDSKIVHDGSAIADVSGTLFLDVHEAAPDRVVLDFDAIGDPVHGSQEGRFFHGYYVRSLHNPLWLWSGRFMQKPLRTQPALFAPAAELDRPLRALDDAESLLDRSEIERLLSSMDGSQTGRPSYPLPALFRGLSLGVRDGFSDVRLSQRLSRDLPFRRFCRLELGGGVPDATTPGRFRSRLVTHDLWELLLGEADRQLEEQRIAMTEGRIHIADAPPVEAARSGRGKRMGGAAVRRGRTAGAA